ncbi:holin family protein [Halalkalibaculum sp. DA384]|uniref:holin family protein n=1 Tax=Halalkalibaculum sp. DA384 TaxID=3373606 RepID=UPI003753FA9F
MEPINAVAKFGLGIIDKLFPDKAEAREAKVKLMELEQQGQLKELEIQMSAILAEARSTDPWTSRARPSFLYVFYVLLLFSIPMGVLTAVNPELGQAINEGIKTYLGALPNELWWLFGTGYLGYVGGRSFDKKKIMEKFAK